MPAFKDLTGQRFGRLTVLYRVQNRGASTMWKCRCDCGNERNISANSLHNGTSASCGCMRRELAAEKHTKHNHCHSRLYTIYNNMKARCYRVTNHKYPRYGGRGIKLCDEWLNDFGKFFDWAMANGYQENLTIDRIDNDGDYEPSNCRWVTNVEQSNNRSSNHLIEFQGQTRNITEWSKITGLSYSAISSRINKLEWSPEKALSTPLLRGKRKW